MPKKPRKPAPKSEPQESPLRLSGHGPVDAKLMFVADGGSDSDIVSGFAMSADVERELANLCRQTIDGQKRTLNYNEAWKTALIKNRVNLKNPDANRPQVTDIYKQVLLDEIKQINPNVIVPIGELSFNFLTGLNGIRKFRGSILPVNPNFQLKPWMRVIPTLGPNPYLYEDAKMRMITRIDLGKVHRNLYNSDEIKEVGCVWIAETATQLRGYIERKYGSAKFLVFDIETFANIPTCISLCFDGFESCCVPILDYTLSIDQRVLMLRLVLQLLSSPIPKVNQNIKFDWRKLNRLGWKVENVLGDTMLAAGCLFCEFPKNLGFLTSIYTDMPYFKDEGKEFDPAKYDRKKLYTYNAKDSLATHQIYQQQLLEIEELGVKKPYQLLMDVMPIYREMEENGLLVDDTQRRKLLSKYWSLYSIYVMKLHKVCGFELNPLSSKRVRELVYDELKWEVVRGIKKDDDGKPRADEESLEILMWSSECNSAMGRQILRTIIACRKLHKVIEILELPLYPDQRMRCEFKLNGAETGRTTAAETSDYHIAFDGKKLKLINLGHSFQTLGKHGFEIDGETYGKDIRSIFVPTPGYSFVECDLSQAEARVDAVLARDFEILKVFDGPVGIHKLTGSWVYDCLPEEIKKNTLVDGVDRYLQAKVTRHAAERNMKEDRLMMMLHRPIKECAQVLKRVHDKQPNIRGVFHRDIREAVRNRNLVAPNGRRRDFYGRFDEKSVNEGISFIPQAIVTDYLKEGIRATMPSVREFVRPVSEAHDGFLAEVMCGREAEYGATFKRNVEKGVDFRSCTLSRDFELIIPCETEWSNTNWMEMKGLKL